MTGTRSGRESDIADLGSTIRNRMSVVVAGTSDADRTMVLRGVIAELTEHFTTRCLTASPVSTSIQFGVFAGELGMLPSEPVTPLHLLDHGLAVFQNLQAVEPVLLGIDNIDLLDDGSATLVGHLVRNRTVVLVATVARECPVWLNQLARNTDTRFVELRPLARAKSDEMVIEHLGGAVPLSVLDTIWSLSAGDPVEITEIVNTGLANRTLVGKQDEWRLAGSLDVTPRIAERFDTLVAGHDDEGRRVLSLVAMLDVAPLRLVEDLASPQVIERLESQGVLTLIQDDQRMRVHFRDARLCTRVAKRTSRMRRRILTAESAKWFLSMPFSRVDDALLVARSSLASGLPMSPEVAVAAAERALDLFKPELAQRICQATMADPPNEDLQLLFARALTDQGQEVDSLLTSRQTQIALLAGTYTNAEIADRLSISRRTVENHLNAAFHALGVHHRSELSAMLGIKV